MTDYGGTPDGMFSIAGNVSAVVISTLSHTPSGRTHTGGQSAIASPEPLF